MAGRQVRARGGCAGGHLPDAGDGAGQGAADRRAGPGRRRLCLVPPQYVRRPYPLHGKRHLLRRWHRHHRRQAFRLHRQGLPADRPLDRPGLRPAPLGAGPADRPRGGVLRPAAPAWRGHPAAGGVRRPAGHGRLPYHHDARLVVPGPAARNRTATGGCPHGRRPG